MNSNLRIDANLVNYGMSAMTMSSPSDPNFVNHTHPSFPNSPADNFSFDGNDNGKNGRNRGNYRCSKCGEPKKGHVCPLVPANFKCNRCGLSKKACACGPADTRTVGIQVEIDPEMTTRAIDLSIQGIVEFQSNSPTFPTSASSAHESPHSIASASTFERANPHAL